LKGDDGDDILIGARVLLDVAMLNDVRNIWTNGSSYDSRVATLTGVGGLLKPNVKVLDDGEQDTLRGGGGRDLFFAALPIPSPVPGSGGKDKVKGQAGNEDLFALF
jgi:hypothetical protein